mmetsp:Transcript_38771/g.79227  ORF Transcript_38771/g.79227 Transcript_38771/m.79227 type:complete len:724 (-) Transcript_38771:205-2376(-)
MSPFRKIKKSPSGTGTAAGGSSTATGTARSPSKQRQKKQKEKQQKEKQTTSSSSNVARDDNNGGNTKNNNSSSNISSTPEEGRDKMHPMARMRKALGKTARRALSPSSSSPAGIRRGRSSSRSRSVGKKGAADGDGNNDGSNKGSIGSIACGASPARWGIYNDTITVQQQQQRQQPDRKNTGNALGGDDNDGSNAAAATDAVTSTADGNPNSTNLAMTAGCVPGVTVAGGGSGSGAGSGLSFGPVQLLQQLMSQNCMATATSADLASLDGDDDDDDDGIIVVGSFDNDDNYDDDSYLEEDDDDEEDEDGSEYTWETGTYDEESYDVSETTGFSSAAPSHGSSRRGGGGGGRRGRSSPRRGRSLGPSPRARDRYTNSSVSRREAAEKKGGSGRHGSKGRRRRDKSGDGGSGSGAGARSRSGGKRGDDKVAAAEGSSRQKKQNESSAADLSSASKNSNPTTEVEEDLSVIGRSVGGGVVRDRTSTSANKNKVDVGDTISEKAVGVKEKTAETKAEDAAAVFVTEGSILKAFVEQITKEGCPLIWHKVQDSNMYMRPTSIRAFISLEDAADESSHMDPCLLWDIIVKDSSTTGVATSGGEPTRGSIGLFDISSVEKAGLMNLSSYPFAIPGNSFFVTLNNGGVILFEAKDEIEQKKFIQGLRWIVARLAFNLIVGNSRICTELLNYGGGEDNTVDAEDETRTMDDVTNHLVDKSIELLAAEKNKTK